MGHKKRNSAPRCKQSPAPAAFPAADGQAQSEADVGLAPIVTKADLALAGPDGSSFASVKLECERALTALRRGNHTKSLRLMKELSFRHENSPHAAFVHRVQGTVFVKVASIINDLNAKQRHLKNAIESARRAVHLSPDSVEFSYFYANLLFEAANEAEHKEVISECERALAIANPIDPAKESLQEEGQQKLTTAEARISHVHGELRNLIQKSKIASISTLVKNLGGGEKFQFIPIRRALEDPMELRLVQARRPNEIKKATKTPEERRKEIEVQVAAARLLQQQQKSESAGSANEGGDKRLDLSGSGPRASSDRRKPGKKVLSPAERKDMVVRSYWSSLSNQKKKQWLNVRVSDLTAHFGLLKDVSACEVISEALEHAEANKTWSFWVCSSCNEKFSDAESHVQHVMQGHLGNILLKIESTLPHSVDDKCVEMIHNCSWKPLDVSAALEMLRNQQKCQDSDPAGFFPSGQKTGNFEDSFRDAWDSSPEKDDVAGGFSSVVSAIESNDLDRSTSSDTCRKNEIHAPLADSPPDKWPLCGDPQRAKILDKIHALFEVLIKNKCLSESHLNRVLQITIKELQGLRSGSQLLNQVVSHTPICICFLAVNQLKKILKFLQEISISCGLGRYPEKRTSLMHETNIADQTREINEKFILNEDASCIILDESLLPTRCTPIVLNDSTSYDTTPNSSKDGPDTDAFLAWIYSGPSSRKEQLESWVHRRGEKAQQHSETFRMLEKELCSLQTLCDRKSELLGYGEALHALEEPCIEEGKRRENLDKMAQRSHVRKRKEDFKGDEHDDAFSNNNYESEGVKNVLRQAETSNANQFGDEDAQDTHFLDLESGENDDGRPKELLHQMNGCIEVTMRGQKEESLVEICKIDAQMMRTITILQNLEWKIDVVTALDYRWILVPLIKSFMRKLLEDLAEKDAVEKSDAAREAFLAELALDSSKGFGGGNDSLKHGNDKTKDKKRQKEPRKTRDLKASGINEQHSHSSETNEPNPFAVSSDGDHSDNEILSSICANELKEQEELKRRMELEAEERKLEETLEYQRKIENEAKQRQLAEKQKKLNLTQLGKATEELSDPADDDDRVKQLKLSTQRTGNSQDFPSVDPVPSGSSIVFNIQKTGSSDHAEVRKGMLDSGSPQDGTISSDQRTGRRGRRQKTKLTEGKLQALDSFGKENAGAGTPDGQSHDNNRDAVNPLLRNYGTKTLRELHAEEDDEDRFQADLKKAVRQSLGKSSY